MNRRLVYSYLTITLIVLLILEVPLALFYAQREEERFIADVERDAVVLASVYEDVLDQGGEIDGVPIADYSDKTGARVVLADEGGISLLDSSAEPSRDFSSRPEVASALEGVRSAGIRYSATLDADLLYVAVPVASGGTVHGVLRITIDPHEVTKRVRAFWLRLVAVAAVVLAAIATMSTTIARSVTRPLRDMQSLARRFASGDLRASEPLTDAPEEINELVEAMNNMATHLDGVIERHRSFVGDASHQLRTPLTGLQLRLENLESDLEKPEDKAEVARAIAETIRLGRIVSDLLKLARAEDKPDVGPVDLVEVVATRVDAWNASLESRDPHVTLDFAGDVPFAGVIAGGAEQILDNLLDNAVAAAPSGSVVTVSVSGSGGHVILAVADHGPGLDAESKERALERFWRGDTSKQGTGLGLAVVKMLVEASGGSVSLSDNEGGGLKVTVAFVAAA